jgi:hypothetical protein
VIAPQPLEPEGGQAMNSSVFPSQFAALESFSAWCLATETERNNRRLASPFQEISSFADAVLPRVDAICAYLDERSVEGPLTDNDKRLYFLLLSLAEVAPAIESYDPQAAVIDGYESARFTPDEKHRLRPAL